MSIRNHILYVSKYYIEGYGDTVFTITDSGADVGDAQFDLFVGPMNRADFELNHPETDPYHKIAVAKLVP